MTSFAHAILAQTGSEVGPDAVDEMAHRIAREAPSLSRLAPEELEAIVRAAVGQRLVRDLDRKVDLAGIDYKAEKETFLGQAGRTKSPNTRRAYASALIRLEGFAARRVLPVLAMKAKDADDFAYALAAEGRAPASVNRDIAAGSSFFSFIERRFEVIRNPFRGTKARLEKKAKKGAAYPSEKEAMAILATLPPLVRAAATVMLFRGLRVGALPSLTIRGERFTARSKGKDISGDLPAEVFIVLRAGTIDARRPFAETTETKLADAIRKRTARLAEFGTIKAAYSAHDFRHLYAVTEYRRDRDIYRVSKLLGHASIQVTETYLRGLGEVD
ncbi:MAG TPA: site-specific integrase [Rectinemataceae bacterium]|nr:site-specific integrase [Rectinemataceae bacterium]